MKNILRYLFVILFFLITITACGSYRHHKPNKKVPVGKKMPCPLKPCG